MRKVDGSKVYRLLYPAVPAVVATSSVEMVAAMPVVSLISLSSYPPMVGFASSPSHATFRAIVETGQFSVSWLDRRYAGSVTELGTNTGLGLGDKLVAAGLHHRAGRALDVPVILEASATLECRFVAAQRFGDHNFVIGEVELAEASEDFADYWTFKEYNPMLYTGLNRPTGAFLLDRGARRP